MHRWGWFALALVVALLLAACGEDDSGPDRPTGSPTGTPAPALDATAEAEDAAPLDYTTFQPGWRVPSGFTVLRTTDTAAGDTGAFFAEVRNDTGRLLRTVEGTLYLLDADNVLLDSLTLNVPLNDIPPGHTFALGRTFPLPDGYAAVSAWLDYTPADAPSLAAFYDLPVTVESHGPGQAVPYEVRGSVQNTAGRDLLFWDVTLIAQDADNQIVGLTHAVLSLDSPGAPWPAGAAVPFEARFGGLAVDPASVASVTAAVAGYAPLDSPG